MPRRDCQLCDRPVDFVPAMAGQRTVCPHCRHEITLPNDLTANELSAIGGNQTAATNDVQLGNVYSTHPTQGSTIASNYSPSLFCCPYCRTNQPPFAKSRISAAGWATFAVLLIVFFPLCWIGLLIKEDDRICSGCQIRLG